MNFELLLAILQGSIAFSVAGAVPVGNGCPSTSNYPCSIHMLKEAIVADPKLNPERITEFLQVFNCEYLHLLNESPGSLDQTGESSTVFDVHRTSRNIRELSQAFIMLIQDHILPNISQQESGLRIVLHTHTGDFYRYLSSSTAGVESLRNLISAFKEYERAMTMITKTALSLDNQMYQDLSGSLNALIAQYLGSTDKAMIASFSTAELQDAIIPTWSVVDFSDNGCKKFDTFLTALNLYKESSCAVIEELAAPKAVFNIAI